jgi:hypothetical protein
MERLFYATNFQTCVIPRCKVGKQGPTDIISEKTIRMARHYEVGHLKRLSEGNHWFDELRFRAFGSSQTVAMCLNNKTTNWGTNFYAT